MDTTNSPRVDAFIGYLVLIAMTVGTLAVAAVEVGLAFDMEFANEWMNVPPLTNVPMWAGSFMWAMLGMVSGIRMLRLWTIKEKNGPVEFATAVCLVITIVTVGGIHNPTFMTFALWANAGIWTLMAVCMLVLFRQEWGSEGGPFAEPPKVEAE